MEISTKEIIVVLAILILVILVTVFGVRSSINSAKTAAAEEMSATLIEVLRSDGYTTTFIECKGLSPKNVAGINDCLLAIQTTTELTSYFKEDQFRNYDEKKPETGYLVIQNVKGAKTFESMNFTFIVNNIEVAHGCTTEGAIAPGYTCKFVLDQKCNPGDNLEIKYNGKRAFLKTC